MQFLYYFITYTELKERHRHVQSEKGTQKLDRCVTLRAYVLYVFESEFQAGGSESC